LGSAREYKFTATIDASSVGSGGAYVEFPFDVSQEFGGKGRVKVLCHFDGIQYQGSLVRMETPCHVVGITKDILKKLQKKIGSNVSVRLVEDTVERVVEVPNMLLREFSSNSNLLVAYQKLSYTRRKEIANLLNSAKKNETRNVRLSRIVKELQGKMQPSERFVASHSTRKKMGRVRKRSKNGT